MPTRTRTLSKRWLLGLALVAALTLVFNLPLPSTSDGPSTTIDGPFSALLASSTDLGRAHPQRVRLTATLDDNDRPDALINWADLQRLSVRWRPGDNWAVIEGDPDRMGTAFGVQVHDYRSRRGQEFYAAPQQPRVPTELHGTVAELGRILSYTTHHESTPPPRPLGVTERGLTPSHLLSAYRADKLAAAGYTALVPDLYRGKSTVEAEEAHHLMSNLNFGDAAGVGRRRRCGRGGSRRRSRRHGPSPDRATSGALGRIACEVSITTDRNQPRAVCSTSALQIRPAMRALPRSSAVHK